MIDPALLRRDVLNRIGAGVVIVDPRTRVIEWANPTAATLFGAPAEQIVGQLCHCFLCPAEQGNCPILDQDKDVENAERVLLRHDGQELAVMKSVKRIRIEGEEKLLETFVDISARKRAEAARRESDDRYRVLFENSRDAMMVLAPPTWKFVSANAATLELFGAKDVATFTALAPWNLSPATQPDGRASAEKAREMIETAMRQGSHFFEWRHLRLDGREFPASIQLTRLEFSGQVLVQATVRDLGPTERTLSALRDSEEQLDKIFNSSTNGIAFTEPGNGRILSVNDTWVRETGISRPDAIGKTAYDLGLWVSQDERDACQQVLELDGCLREFETTLVFKGVRRRYALNAEYVELRRGRFLLWEFRDITERERAEETLRRYELLASHSRDIVLFVRSDDGRIVEANRAAEDAYGYGRDELLSLSIRDLRAPSTKAMTEAQMALVDASGLRFETVHQRKDGRPFSVEVSSDGVTVGGVRMLMSVVRDITERARMEGELRESEARFRTLFEDSPLAIALTRGVETLYVNKMFQKVFTLASAEALVGQSIMACVAPESQGEIIERTRQRALGNPLASEYEITGLRADGAKFPIRVVVAVVHLPEGQATLFFITDLSERRRAEEEIALLKHSIDVHYDAAYWTDSDGKFIYVNEAGSKVLGFEAGELIGKTIQEVNPKATPERMRVVWDKLRKDGFHKGESTHRRRDGSEISVEILTSYVQFAGKEYTCGFARDLTEQKRAEEETARLTGQLQQAQKMESVGRLAGGVAHDFNNMLGVILGHCELGLEKVAPSSSLHGDLMNIQTAAQRSADLTRQLLAFARKQTVAPKVLHLNETVAGMLKMVKRLIGEDVKLAWHPGENLWPVKIDPTQIDQILANLCVNARDAIADVGTITIATGAKVVGVDDAALSTGAAPGDYVCLSVSDDGCGMDANTLSHVFEPFFTTKEVGKGTGLGLATVYGIVNQNSGFIDLRSELGQGTAFTVYLPRHVGKDPKERVDVAAAVQPGQETILLVEDEAPLLEVTQRMLEKRGYKVVSASTPGQAIQLAREHVGNIDLLITDVVMPEMNGRDLAKNILALYPRTKRLFMSGYTADVIAHQGVLDEGVSFIQKPFSAKDLAATVRRVLDIEQAKRG